MPTVHAAVQRILGHAEDAGDGGDDSGEKGSILDRFIQLVSSLLQPILWTLAGAGLYKAFLSLAVTLGFDNTSTEYEVMNAAGDAIIYFLPIALAVTASKRFKTNTFTSLAIAGALVYPNIIAMVGAEGGHTFFGIPLILMNYSSSMIPILVAVWIQGYMERFLSKHIPAILRNFSVPLIVLVVLVPLVFLTVGPATTLLSQAIADGVTWLFAVAPWLAGGLLGAFWQVFVMFGLHWGLVPVIVLQLADGFSVITGPLLAAVLAQASATLAVAVRTRDANTRSMGYPAAVAGFLSGITEPAIYGINLPRKLPFYFGIAGGAVGGIMGGLAGAGTSSFVFPSLIGIPAYLDKTPNVPLLIIGVVVGCVISFTLTFLFGVKDEAPTASKEAADQAGAKPAQAATAAAAAAAPGKAVVLSPVDGKVVSLEKVNDPVFSGGAMGKGVGIVPADGVFRAPVSGKIVVAMDSGHAYGIKTVDGVEILIHIGIDTVNLKGEHFTSYVQKGALVEAGDILAEVDLAAVRTAGYDTTTIVVVTNTAAHKAVTPASTGDVATASPIIEIDK